ncbi:LPS export ABC transporter permease LptG [Pollutimonas harenae]|uniref:LPS export ABC transporter permease LptG n=1 Tax=Pollutimonas harenae TaxID=657015 RepID=A0A853H1Q8_9BURK|nr:LPS export ABC transporter permease LptG [Pollutimonas harenae]NYT84094.1 LPS export ABC transporter permease LptG [Pollutimonas harenae]TEA73482.1 LPS export ABC transporter permease LptG [Pollutimonas harenae]
MRTARRYLAKEIYRSTMVVLMALIGLFTFFALIEELDNLSNQFTLLNLFYMQALALPTTLYDLLPIGLLIGAILALAGLAQRNELVILRVSGVSGMKLLTMLWIVTIPLVFGAFILSEIITPAAEIKSSEASLTLLGKAGGGRLNSGYWFKESDNEDGTRIINIAQLKSSGNVADITLYEFKNGQELARFSTAKQGQFTDGTLVLSDVKQTTVKANSLSTLANAVQPDGPLTLLETLPKRTLKTSLTPERLIARVLTPERMSIRVLLDYIDYLENNSLQTDRQIVALWRKMAYPFTLLVMITIAAPISFMQTRRGGVGSKVFIGILLGVGFFMLNQLALNVGMLNQWAPWVTALLPNLGALGLALGALTLMENQHNVRRFNQTRWPWSKSTV